VVGAIAAVAFVVGTAVLIADAVDTDNRVPPDARLGRTLEPQHTA